MKRQNIFNTVLISLLMFAGPLACGGQSVPDEAGQEVVATEPSSDVLDAADYIESLEMQKPELNERSISSLATKYDFVDPKGLIPDVLLAKALSYYDTNQKKIANKKYLSVIDFSSSSVKSRFFIIDMTTGAVQAYHVAHGSGSDKNHDGYAEKFSNTSGSNASSLGYYLTAETYNGKHGLSLRLDGLSSTNSNVRARAVVIHGASYVSDKDVKQGRSWGCPAVSMANKDKIIKMLKGGSLIYAGLSK